MKISNMKYVILNINWIIVATISFHRGLREIFRYARLPISDRINQKISEFRVNLSIITHRDLNTGVGNSESKIEQTAIFEWMFISQGLLWTGAYLFCTTMFICIIDPVRVDFFSFVGSHRVHFFRMIFYKILPEIRPAPWYITVTLLYDISFYTIRWYRIENWSRCTVSAFLRQYPWEMTSSRVFIQRANRVSHAFTRIVDMNRSLKINNNNEHF